MSNKVTRVKKPASLLNLKVSEKDRKILVKKAKMYTDGNVSELLRIAGALFNPKISDFIR